MLGAVPDAECDVPCGGEPARMCGGASRLSVYRRAGTRGVLLGVGSYTSYDLMRMRLPPRALSSVRLPAGLELTLYQHDGFDGLTLNLTQDTPCLRDAHCAMPARTRTWAEPPQGCAGGTWDDAAGSVRLRYVGRPPAYAPRPNQETGARAFELSTQGQLTRLYDLGGDPSASAAERPDGAPLSPLLAAPRADDSTECARATGSFTADRVCVQAADVAFAAADRHGHQNSFYAWWRANALRHTEEHKRLAREEWRDALREYAAPFYDELVLRGELNATKVEADDGGDGDDSYEAWFTRWLASLMHLLPMLLPPEQGAPHAGAPMLGLDDVGAAVPLADATAPPLPPHPMLSAESLEHVLTPEAAARSDVPSAVAAAAAAFEARAAAALRTAEVGPRGEAPHVPHELQAMIDYAGREGEEVFEFSLDEFERGTAAAEVKAALHTYALGAGAPEPDARRVSRDPDAGEALFTDFR